MNNLLQIKVKHHNFSQNPEDLQDLKSLITKNLSLEEKKTKFRLFEKVFGKKYNKNENKKRFNIFSKNLDEISRHNQSNSSFKMGINKFTDLTEDEFKNAYLMKTNN